MQRNATLLRRSVHLIAVLFACSALALCQDPTMTVYGLDASKTTFSAADLAKLPQQTIKTTSHGKTSSFQGVLLGSVLSKVPLPSGEKFHQTAASYYLVAEGMDGYKAVFAWAELDSSFMDKAVYVATAGDGKPLPQKTGPFQLVVPGEKRDARWVHQLKSIRIEQAK